MNKTTMMAIIALILALVALSVMGGLGPKATMALLGKDDE